MSPNPMTGALIGEKTKTQTEPRKSAMQGWRQRLRRCLYKQRTSGIVWQPTEARKRQERMLPRGQSPANSLISDV